jgi:hypothetical protein
MVAAGALGFEIQSYQSAKTATTVQVLGGGWAVYRDTGLLASAGCGGCPSSTTGPLDTVTVHVTMHVAGAKDSGCSACGGYNVTSIAVEPPFHLLHSEPSTFPTLVPQNGSAEWNLTVEVPSLPGSYYLNGFIDGASY